jgi:hypothetical protein
MIVEQLHVLRRAADNWNKPETSELPCRQGRLHLLCLRKSDVQDGASTLQSSETTRRLKFISKRRIEEAPAEDLPKDHRERLKNLSADRVRVQRSQVPIEVGDHLASI